MTGMEAAIASGILKVAGDKLASVLASEFATITGVEKDLLVLQDKHGEIASWLPILCDLSIENHQRFGWVSKLKDVAHDIDDLLFEVHLDAEKHKIASASGKQAMTDIFSEKLKSCFLADFLSEKLKSCQYRFKVAHRIKAIQLTLAAIEKQRSEMIAIGHNIPQSEPIRSRNKANVELSLLTNVEESQIPTRDQEKVSIICKLLESNEGEHDRTVSIVGLGGSGKTTLAKHICHDNKIKEHFKDKIYWVHVSEEFDLKKLVGKVFEAITKQKSDLHVLQHMLDEISKKLTGEQFILVLDDAWHQDKEDWNKFMQNIRSGKAGSKLLLTTRDKKVAEAVKSEHIFDLVSLPNVESWSLFLKNAGWKEEDLGSDFIKFGKEIVNKCGGVPLAIKTLGGILSEKSEISTWRAISQSDLWNEENIEGQVFASLKLSYIHLNDHLKECFLFCSIFPKGCRIYKNYLIEQWIANGLIKQTMGEQLEVIGSEYFDSLVKVGFLQDPRVSSYSNRVKYKMHDLVHDLTQYILQDEVATSPLKNTTKGCTQKCRYLSLSSCDNRVERVYFDRVRALCVLEANQSLDKLVKKSHYLCSAVLKCENHTPFPQFILKLDYIGYLEIKNVECTKLPEGITSCWNLQSLHFIRCSGFAALPMSIGKLKKLRTLELIACADLVKLPQSIGDCRDLQSLQIVRCGKFTEVPITIGKNEKLRILHIVDCRNLQQPQSDFFGKFSSIQTINLEGCVLLKDLPSTFSSCTLRTLNLSRTGLAKLPEWVTMISTLECINLENCTDLVELPRGIGKLKRLEFLNLKGCNGLQWMPSGFAQLTRLKRLDKYVVGDGGDGSRLSDLENLDMISGEMELKNIPHLMESSDAEKPCLKKKKNLRSLVMTWSESVMEEEFRANLGVLDALEPPSGIEELQINGYQGSLLPHWMSTQSDSSYLESAVLNQTSQPRFLSLIKLSLRRMPNLRHMRGILVLPSLKTLHLETMPNLEELWTTTSGSCLGEEEEVGVQHCFPALSHLLIFDCPKLIVEPFMPPSLELLHFRKSHLGVSQGRTSFRLLPPHLKILKLDAMMTSDIDWGFFHHATSLECLEFWDCNDLMILPVSMRGLTGLKELCIANCPTLTALPEWLGELRSLQSMTIWKIPMMENLPRSIEHLTSLTRLQIVRCDNLKQLPDMIQHLTSLEVLSLHHCNALTMLPEEIGKLAALEWLFIIECPALQSLPSSIERLTSLRWLRISNCPELARRYKKEVGDDWHLVSHIPGVHIS